MIKGELAAAPVVHGTTRDEAGLLTAPRGAMTLVVDDDADCRDVTAKLLSRAGHQVRTARGLNAALAEIADPDIGLVITDLCMPEGNGMQLVEHLAAKRPDMAVIVFSGYATASTRQAALDAGCIGVVDKPNVGELLAAARRGLENSRETRLAAARDLPQKPRLGRVLLADDHPDLVEVVSRLLDRSGYDTVTARDGAEALARFTPGAFDMVLLDVNMPRLDGVEATREIRRRDQAVSILLLTGEASYSQIQTATAAGAKAVFSKPMDLALLEQLAGACVVETRSRRQRLEHEARRARRNLPEKAWHWMTGRRTRHLRSRAVVVTIALALSIALIPPGVAVAERGCDAISATAGFVASIPLRMNSLEGYLRRDEQRELEARSTNRRVAAGDFSGLADRLEGYLQRDEQRKIGASASQSAPNPGSELLGW